MSGVSNSIYLTHDNGLLSHWKRALRDSKGLACADLGLLRAMPQVKDACLVWVDLSLPGLGAWTDPVWKQLIQQPNFRFIAASSNPKESNAIEALDAGCAGYCHAFADSRTLRQVEQVVRAGHVWIGAELMQKLIQTANRAAPVRPAEIIVDKTWSDGLTTREKQVAQLAANGASNQQIAKECQITERTVKAHLSAIFEKLKIADRLQLALKVHGIQT